MGDPICTIPALPPRPLEAASSPASSLVHMPVTVAAVTSAVPVIVCGAAPAPAPAPVVGAAPAPAPVVDAGAGAVPIIFVVAAAHREAIREEARRKKAQVPWCLWTENHCCFLMLLKFRSAK
ncbi:unnamed protein product [Urochloa humidicola]